MAQQYGEDEGEEKRDESAVGPSLQTTPSLPVRKQRRTVDDSPGTSASSLAHGNRIRQPTPKQPSPTQPAQELPNEEHQQPRAAPVAAPSRTPVHTRRTVMAIEQTPMSPPKSGPSLRRTTTHPPQRPGGGLTPVRKRILRQPIVTVSSTATQSPLAKAAIHNRMQQRMRQDQQQLVKVVQ